MHVIKPGADMSRRLGFPIIGVANKSGSQRIAWRLPGTIAHLAFDGYGRCMAMGKPGNCGEVKGVELEKLRKGK
jgi:hypothetical protein